MASSWQSPSFDIGEFTLQLKISQHLALSVYALGTFDAPQVVGDPAESEWVAPHAHEPVPSLPSLAELALEDSEHQLFFSAGSTTHAPSEIAQLLLPLQDNSIILPPTE
ncbi:MAG: hypothetical protein ACRCUZ_11225 [Shewanella sp.]